MAERIIVREREALLTGLFMLFSGLGLGWMIGLSAAPFVQTILLILLVAVAAATSVLAGLAFAGADQDSPWRVSKFWVNPLPVASLVLGLVIGWSAGVYAGTNLWLGPNAKVLSERTGLPAQEINKRALEQLYPPPPLREETNLSAAQTATVNRNPAVPFPTPVTSISPSENSNTAQTPSPVATPDQPTQNPTQPARAVQTRVTRAPVPIRRPPSPPRRMSVPSRISTEAGDVSSATAGSSNLEIKVSGCNMLKSLEGEPLQRSLLTQTDPKVRAFGNRVSDPNVLKIFVEEVLCPISK